jgi:ferredoxin
MAKRVVMIAEIVEDQCTGCNKCVLTCPTVAISMRPRRPDEPGPGRNIAVVQDNLCYNAQNCIIAAVASRSITSSRDTNTATSTAPSRIKRRAK